MLATGGDTVMEEMVQLHHRGCAGVRQWTLKHMTPSLSLSHLCCLSLEEESFPALKDN